LIVAGDDGLNRPAICAYSWNDDFNSETTACAESTIAAVSNRVVVLFVYGLIRYPDLPIRECPSGYCGKQGQPHTAAEYSAFNAWQIALMIGWPIGIAALLFLQREKLKGSK
jgi:hypothetical protein